MANPPRIRIAKIIGKEIIPRLFIFGINFMVTGCIEFLKCLFGIFDVGNEMLLILI